MKRIKLVIAAALFFMGGAVFAQTNSITGKLTALRAYNDEYAFTVDSVPLVLIKNVNNKTKTSFDINPEYKNILIKRKGVYVLNPKYADKVFKISYTVNGKGWKCIKTIESVK